MYINFADAALGVQKEVPVINGKVKIKIEPGTQSGKILRLRNKGLPDIDGYGRGDQLVSVNVWTPTEITDEERELLEKLRGSENMNHQPSKQDKSFVDRMKEFFS